MLSLGKHWKDCSRINAELCRPALLPRIPFWCWYLLALDRSVWLFARTSVFCRFEGWVSLMKVSWCTVCTWHFRPAGRWVIPVRGLCWVGSSVGSARTGQTTPLWGWLGFVIHLSEQESSSHFCLSLFGDDRWGDPGIGWLCCNLLLVTLVKQGEE